MSNKGPAHLHSGLSETVVPERSWTEHSTSHVSERWHDFVAAIGDEPHLTRDADALASRVGLGSK